MNELITEVREHVGMVTIDRPPNNFFDVALIEQLAEAFEAFAANEQVRALLLAANGRHFCAGADFRADEADQQGGTTGEDLGADRLYAAAARLFACPKPVVAAVQGSAVGGGLGLALVADFRVATPSSRFSANFVKLGIHPGFGLTLTLPRLLGVQKAQYLMLTGRRINGEEALEMGLVDELWPEGVLKDMALELAAELAANAPLAVESTRATLRQGLVEAFRAQTVHEFAEQKRLFSTEDHAEGVRAVRERRPGQFRRR